MFSYRRKRDLDAQAAPIQSLLVVCTGNLCRSPMAAALFLARAREHRHRLRVASAGIAAFNGQPPPGPIIALMAERGLDLSRHRAQQLTGPLARRHDLILVMDRQQQSFVETHWSDLKGRVYRLGAWRDQEVSDPYGCSERGYLDCLTKIEAAVSDWEPRLLSDESASRVSWPA